MIEALDIIPLNRESIPGLVEMMLELWPECNREEETKYVENLNSDQEIFFLAKRSDEFIGFVQVALRQEYVEGTHSSPVGYLEGLFVKPEFRKKGIAGTLVHKAEYWAMKKGCSEMASDTEINNQVSEKFHRTMGYEIANKVICFRKDLK